MNVSLVSWTQWPEHICILAAKTCYSSKKPEEIWEQMHGRRFDLNENDKEYLAKRIEEGHLSVVEHASFTFAISGISRVCSHQLVRHRLASYSQQSQRYVKMDGGDWFVVPPTLKDKPAYEELLRHSIRVYEELMNNVPKEDARFTLPNATKTNIIVTMNARELLHFFRLRTCKKAQWEIRRLANRMLKEAKKNAPTLFANAGPPCVTEETCPEEDWECLERMKRTRNNQKRMKKSTSPDSSV